MCVDVEYTRIIAYTKVTNATLKTQESITAPDVS